MGETSLLMVLGLSFLIGMKHAMDPDHLAAIMTFVDGEKSIFRGCMLGLFWGFGHALALSIAGLIVVGLRVPISKWLAARLEFGVAIMLVALGARLVASTHRRWHARHRHTHWTRFGVRPLLVGLLHGAAGSAALTLLVLSTLSSTVHALLYIWIFGLGSMIGMVAISVLFSVPVRWTKRNAEAALRPIQIAAGAFSCFLGIYLGIGAWPSL